MVSIRTTACKWDSIIPFNKHIKVKKGKKEIVMYEDEWVMNECETTNKSIHYCREEFREKCVEGMWDKLNKLIKPNGAIILFGSEPFSSSLRMSNIKNYKYDWKWDKKKPSTGLHAKIMPLKDYEDVIVFNVKKENYNPVMKDAEIRNDKARFAKNGETFGGREVLRKHSNNGKSYPRSIIKDFSNANQNNRSHPTQKPVALMEYLIKTYTNEGEIVLDFTAGSFSTGVACQSTNRQFIGIEKEEKYFNIGLERMIANDTIQE